MRPIASYQRETSPPAERVLLLDTAIELEVDKSDFRFQSGAEEQVWDELEHAFHERTTRLGRVWIAA